MTPGKVEAKGEVFIQVRSLKSIEKDGKPYSDKMDEVMWEHMKETREQARSSYRLSELTLKEAPKAKDAPYVFDAKGELAVAGVTNKIAMTVNVLPLGEKKLKITGTHESQDDGFQGGTARPEDRAGPDQDRRRRQADLRVDAWRRGRFPPAASQVTG